MFYRNKFIEVNANSVDPVQMPHSVASDLGLHCFPIILLWVSNLKWVNRLTSRLIQVETCMVRR